MELKPPPLPADRVARKTASPSEQAALFPATLPTGRRGWLIRRALLFADLVGLTLSFVVAELLFGPTRGVADHVGVSIEFAVFFGTLPAWIVIGKLYGLYDRDEERADHTTFDDFRGVFHLLSTGSWLVVAAAWLFHLAYPDFAKLVAFWSLAIVLVTFGRTLARGFCHRRPSFLQNTIVVGAGEVGQLVARKIMQHPEYGIRLVGFVDAAPKQRDERLGDLTLLGAPEELPQLISALGVERVIVAFSQDSHEESLELLRSLRGLNVRVDVVPRLFEGIGTRFMTHAVEGLPLIGLLPLSLPRSSRLLKRALDLCLSVLGLVLFAPFFALVAIAIKLDSTGPVFFRQVRMGGGGTFRIFKFRTMVADAEDRKSEFAYLNRHSHDGGDTRMFKIVDDPRVTRVGRVLRRYFVDELPQLINVFKGEMSLVGPRPLILDEDAHVEEWARKRLELTPGMTGHWQVLGRSAIPFEEMVNLDYLYVTTWSLWNDLRLLFATVPVVVRGDGRHA
jgi:exopolysaccharide biosynthesis polyprenyl glycosylphosphotransferase